MQSGWVLLKEYEAGTRVAITELTISPEGPEGFEMYRLAATAAGNLACFGVTAPEAPGVDTCAGAGGFTY